MKKSLIGLLVIGLVFFVTGSASGLSVWLNPSSQTVSNGTVCTVQLLVSGVPDPGVDTWNLELDFNPDLINITGVSSSGMFMDIETYITFGPDLDNVAGYLSYTMWNLGGSGATGDGTVAVMTFVSDAANTGVAALEYTSWLLKPGSGQFTPDSTSTGDNIIVGSTTDNGPPPIPEPASLLLVAAGLAALGGYARKKRS